MKIHAVAVLRAATVSIWLIAALAIATEIFAPLKSFLTSLLGQHWSAKSVISLIVFFVLYLIFSRSTQSKAVVSSASTLALSAVVGGIAIFGFYVWLFLSK